MKWKPDEWVCIIWVKRFLLAALWSDCHSLHKTLFHRPHLHVCLTLQVLSDIKCLHYWMWWGAGKQGFPPQWLFRPPSRHVTFLVLQVLNPLSLCEPSPSSAEGGLDPHTPSSIYPSHPCSALVFGLIFGRCVPGSNSHWRGTFLPTPFSLKPQGHRIELPIILCSWHTLTPSPRRSFLFCIFISYWGKIYIT